MSPYRYTQSYQCGLATAYNSASAALITLPARLVTVVAAAEEPVAGWLYGNVSKDLFVAGYQDGVVRAAAVSAELGPYV